MQQLYINEKFPIFKLEFSKPESRFQSAQAIINYLKQLIDDHEVTRFIAEFDHYSHTKGMETSKILAEIIDARNIVFCFGSKLLNADVLALSPRSMGIVETEIGFSVSFLEAPMQSANDTMKSWVSSLLIEDEREQLLDQS